MFSQSTLRIRSLIWFAQTSSLRCFISMYFVRSWRSTLHENLQIDLWLFAQIWALVSENISKDNFSHFFVRKSTMFYVLYNTVLVDYCVSHDKHQNDILIFFQRMTCDSNDNRTRIDNWHHCVLQLLEVNRNDYYQCVSHSFWRVIDIWHVLSANFLIFFSHRDANQEESFEDKSMQNNAVCK